MAKNKTNWNTLIALLAIVVIAAIGLLTSFVPKTSGAAEGLVNFTISGALSITLPNSIVDFGTGYVTPGNTYAILDSNSTLPTGWTSTANGVDDWPSNTDYIVVENNGNVNANVTIKAEKTANDFIGGTNPAQWYAAMNNEDSSCTSNLQSDYADLTTSETNLCENLGYADSADTLNVMFKLRVPSDASPAAKSNTITFTAYQV